MVHKALQSGDLQLLESVHQQRNAWMEDLQRQGIYSPATHAVHMLSYYRDKYQLSNEHYPLAQAANDCSISLPLFHGMSTDEQQHVIDVVRSRIV